MAKREPKEVAQELETSYDMAARFSALIAGLKIASDLAVTRRESARHNTPRRSFEAGQAEAYSDAMYRVQAEWERLRHSELGEFDDE